MQYQQTTETKPLVNKSDRGGSSTLLYPLVAKAKARQVSNISALHLIIRYCRFEKCLR